MKNLLLILIAGLLTACSTAQLAVRDERAVNSASVSKISPGVTTRDELGEMFGKPEMKIPAGGVSYYFYKDLNLNGLWVVFNENWTVQDFKWSN